jgi:hypothetical protein
LPTALDLLAQVLELLQAQALDLRGQIGGPSQQVKDDGPFEASGEPGVKQQRPEGIGQGFYFLGRQAFGPSAAWRPPEVLVQDAALLALPAGQAFGQRWVAAA